MALIFKQSEKMLDDLLGAQECIQVCLFLETGIWLFQTLLKQAKKGVKVELIVFTSVLQYLDLNPQYFERLSKSGGQFFEIRSNVSAKLPFPRLNLNFILIDSKKQFTILPQEGRVEESHLLIEEYQENFAFLKKESFLLGQQGSLEKSFGKKKIINSAIDQNNLLDIKFEAKPAVLFPGQSFVLEWEVSEGAKVSIDNNIGDVDRRGSKVITARSDLEFKISAERDGVELSKLVQVRVDEKPVIKYQLTTLDIATGQEIQLHDRKDFPHHFGIIKGQAITLYWDVINADQVVLDGFGEVPLKGFKVFTPSQLRAFTIIAENSMESFKQIIVINVFEPPSMQKIQSSLPENMEIKSSIEFSQLNLPNWMSMPASVEVEEVTLANLDEETQAALKKRWLAEQKKKSGLGIWSKIRKLLFGNQE